MVAFTVMELSEDLPPVAMLLLVSIKPSILVLIDLRYQLQRVVRRLATPNRVKSQNNLRPPLKGLMLVAAALLRNLTL